MVVYMPLTLAAGWLYDFLLLRLHINTGNPTRIWHKDYTQNRGGNVFLSLGSDLNVQVAPCKQVGKVIFRVELEISQEVVDLFAADEVQQRRHIF